MRLTSLAIALGLTFTCAAQSDLPSTTQATETAQSPASTNTENPKRDSSKKASQAVHPKIGITATSSDGHMSITLIDRKQNYTYRESSTLDPDIQSPKSVNVHPSGKKYYVNSLEGGSTVVYDFPSNRKLKVISHQIGDKHAAMWSEPSEFYKFTHYTSRPDKNRFTGKPVESTFTHSGRYLWVPYYRRSYDINAQDPSAVAIIDTKTDEIVRLMETGPLPKMIATSPDGKTVAITHWGDNTVGLIDVSSPDPKKWRHTACHVVDYKLPLNYPLDRSVNRDNGSGYALRGTVFTPDGRYLLVGCMGGGGGIAVIDLKQGKYLGRLLGMMGNVRHLAIRNSHLYLSINGAGYVQDIPLREFLATIPKLENAKTATVSGWRSCKVGGGARTITLSPRGAYIFAACNNASQIHVVSARYMKPLASIPADSYPVGLDISKDGRYLFVTSQAHPGSGGNCVDIYRIDYH